MKALIRTIPLVLLALALAGCGSSSTTPLEGPTIAYLYVVGQGANTIFPFRSVSDGEISSLSLSFPSNPIPVAMVLHPNKGLVYVANSTSNTVSGYTLDHQTGTLTPVGTAIAPSPICPASPPCATSTPVSVAIDSSGRFLFVLNQGSTAVAPALAPSISVFSIDTTRGLLTLIPDSHTGLPFALPAALAGEPQHLVISPNSSFLYVSNGAAGSVAQITFDSNGQLTNNTPSTVSGAAGANLAGMAIDPKGQFLYVADSSSNDQILTFSIGASGALSQAATFALSSVTAETIPVSIAIDATGSFLYSANRGNDNITALKISSGTLSVISGSPYSSRGTTVSNAAQPSIIIVDVTNAFVYVGNQGSRDIMGFTINSSTGQLTTVTNAPFSMPLGPTALLSTR
jgi:6-phosphogluconolactonase (cycloisomerase 2 family)